MSKLRGPWSEGEVQSFLRQTRVPLRLACNSTARHPQLVSLWFVALEGQLWCATRRDARIVSLLRDDPLCSFEVSLETVPYRGVRGPAVATLHEDRGEEILRTLLDRYLGGTSSSLAKHLLGRVQDECAIALHPQRIVSWDFSERMQDVA